MKAQLVITWEDNGNINVQGPIENKLITYGLLEAARDAIKDFNDKAASGIVAPPAGFSLPKA